MLGRKTYTKEEIANGRAAVKDQLTQYRKLVKGAGNDNKVAAVLGDFEVMFFNSLAFTLDRYYVHRLRGTTGKGGTPLNELELIVESLMNNGGVMRGNNVVKYIPDDAVTKIGIGDKIRLTEDDFARLSDGVFAELEEKYLD